MKLYCNQVYVADNYKELIPEFLTLLKGAIDCPDLPLNVSRSYLQNDPKARKIAEHIVKKVADKLTGLAKTDRDNYLKFWDDIAPFIKFGMMQDQPFRERMMDHVLFKTWNGEYLTLPEYSEKYKEKTKDHIFYCSDEHAQASYLKLFKGQGIDVIIANTMLDNHFLPYMEMFSEQKYKFKRIDAEVSDFLVDEESDSKIVDPKDNKDSSEKLTDLFKKFLGKDKVEVKVQNLKTPEVPGMLVFDENLRRMKEMSQMGRAAGGKPSSLTDDEHVLVVNKANPAIKKLLQFASQGNHDAEMQLIVDHVYDLAYMQQGQFNAEMMERFIDRSARLLEKI